MKLFGPFARAFVLAGLLVSGAAAPAFAGPAEIEALAAYLGTWNGAGTVTGSMSESVSCKMAMSRGNGGKLNYTGRCSLGGQQLSVTGTIAYVDADHRYEAVMNSGIGNFRGVAYGKLQGKNIVFDLQQRGDDNEGNDISIAAKIVLSGANAIAVSFHAVFNSNGDTVDAKVPFKKA